MRLLDRYAEVVGEEAIDEIRLIARQLSGTRVLMVNSTRRGGGVAEILERLVPLLNELDIEVDWEVVSGNADFFEATKTLHNGLQGNRVDLRPGLRRAYEEAAERHLAEIDTSSYEVVVVHDPQPAALIRKRRRDQRWIWRCHVDASRPDRSVWRFLRSMVVDYDASVFSLARFSQNLDHPQFLLPPSIDPLSPKNRQLPDAEVDDRLAKLGVPRDLPLLLQVSRYDRFKDPVGVIRAFRIVRDALPCRLVLAGGDADDDPEGAEVLAEVREEGGGDPDIHILVLPSDAHLDINALQRAADIVLQKSTREGFGLTVTEAMYKARPVIGGAVGGIALQIKDGVNGYLVHSVAGAAHRIRYLLHRPQEAGLMGARGKQLAARRFLLTRQLRDWLLILITVREGDRRVVKLACRS